MQRMRQGAAKSCERANVKRRLIIAAVFLLAGAVVNVAVAWGCARWPRDIFFISSANTVALSFQDIAWWNKHVAAVFPCHAESGWKTREVGIEASIVVSAVSLSGHVAAIHVASGWPARSLSGEFWGSYGDGKPPQWSERRAVVVDMNRSFVIPVRPIWPGFAVNTLIYAAALWLLIPGPFALRRFVRVKRGLCPACCYPMGESAVCSECGKGLPSRRIIV